MDFYSKITVFENFLPDNVFNKIEHFLWNTHKWTINRSNINDNYLFWGMDLNDEKLFNKEIFNIVKKKTKKNLKINRILANGQSILQDGLPHTDSLRSNAKTLIIYANRNWEYSWGGQTFLFDAYAAEGNENAIKVSDDVKTIYPLRNTAVLFPSNMFHYGSAPTKQHAGIRFTIAYHMEEY